MKLGAGENVDFKQYEAGMRFLLDTYIEASASKTLSNLEDAGLIQLIVDLGPKAIEQLPEGVKQDPEAVAETITNNMRKVITDERPLNPKYYDRMSQLLDAIIEERRQNAIDYKEYLDKLVKGAQQLGSRQSDTVYPDWADNGAKQALVDFFYPDDHLAIEIDTVVRHTKPDSWVGSPMKEKKVRLAVQHELPDDFDRVDELMDLVKARHEYR